MATVNPSPMEAIRSQCPLLSEKLSRESLLAMLAARSIPVAELQLERAAESGTLESLVNDAGEAVYTRGHLIVLYQLTRHSRLDWYPWDDRRPDREDLLFRRVTAKRAVWAEIASDALCLKAFYDWFWGDDIAAFSAFAAVRLTEVVRWSLKNIDESGYLSQVAEKAGNWREAHGPVLFAAELVRLKLEIEQLLKNAAAAGIHVPEASEVARDRHQVIEDASPNDDPNPLYAAPSHRVPAKEREAFTKVRDQWIREQDWDSLRKHLLDHTALFANDDEAQVSYHLALAYLNTEHLDDNDAAVESYRAVLAIRVGDPRVIAALQELLSSLERWETWAEILGEQADRVTDSEIRETLRLFRARVLAVRLGRESQALELFTASLGEESAREDAVAVLSGIILDGSATPSFDVAAIDLVSKYMAIDDETFAELFERVEALELTFGQRCELLYCQATREESGGHLHKAFISYTRALSANPISARVHVCLERLSRIMGNRDELAAILEDEFEKASGLGARAFIGERLGRLHVELGQGQRAIEYLEVAHEAQPTHTELVVLLAELYQKHGQIDRAISMLEKLRTLSTDEQEKEGIAEILGELRAQALGDPSVALETYRGMLQTDTGDEAVNGLLVIARGDDLTLAVEALHLIDAPMTRLKRGGELIDLYTRLMDYGEIEATDTGVLERLCAHLRREPNRSQEALTRHGELYALRGDAATLASAKALMTDKESVERWVRAVEDRLTHTPEDTKVKVLKQLARTYSEQLRDPVRAVAVQEQLLASNPADKSTFLALDRWFQDQKEFQKLLQLRLERAAAVAEERSEWMLAAAATMADDLNDLRGAFTIYSSALQADPSNAAIEEARAELLRRPNVMPEQKAALLEYAESTSEGEQWLAHRLNRATMAGTQGQSELAVELLREASELLPEREDVLEALEAQLRRSNRWSEAAGVLRRRIDLGDASQKRLLTKELAKLYAEHLEMGEEARLLLNEVNAEERTLATAAEQEVRAREEEVDQLSQLKLNVGSATGSAERAAAVEALSDHLVESDGLDAALAGLDAETRNPEMADQVARLHLKAAALAEANGRLELAEISFKKVLAINSSELRFVDPLIAFYRRTQAWQKQSVLMKFRLAKTPDPKGKVSLLAEMANVAERLQDYRSAIDALSQLLNLSKAQSVALDTKTIRRNLAGLLVRVGSHDEAIEQLELLYEALRGDLAATAFFVETGADLAQLIRGENPQRAKEIYVAIQAVNSSHPKVRLLGADLLVDAEELDAALDATSSMVKDTSVPKPSLTLLLSRLAKSFESLGKTEKVSEAYKQLLELHPNHPEALSFFEQQSGS